MTKEAQIAMAAMNSLKDARNVLANRSQDVENIRVRLQFEEFATVLTEILDGEFGLEQFAFSLVGGGESQAENNDSCV